MVASWRIDMLRMNNMVVLATKKILAPKNMAHGYQNVFLAPKESYWRPKIIFVPAGSPKKLLVTTKITGTGH